MIRYTLRCDNDHAFESWFQSAAGYDALVAAGQVACPECGSGRVVKALMAPAVAADAGRQPGLPRALTAPSNPREAALAALRKRIEEKSEYVGMNFVAEARAIQSEEGNPALGPQKEWNGNGPNFSSRAQPVRSRTPKTFEPSQP